MRFKILGSLGHWFPHVLLGFRFSKWRKFNPTFRPLRLLTETFIHTGSANGVLRVGTDGVFVATAGADEVIATGGGTPLVTTSFSFIVYYTFSCSSSSRATLHDLAVCLTCSSYLLGSLIGEACQRLDSKVRFTSRSLLYWYITMAMSRINTLCLLESGSDQMFGGRIEMNCWKHLLP